MMEVSFEINGRKVHPNRIADELEKAVYQQIKDELVRKVGRIRDPKTGKRPKLKVKGRSLDDLTIEVSGSPELIEKVQQKLR